MTPRIAAAVLGAVFALAMNPVQAATCAEEYCYDSLGRLQVALLCGTEYRYSYDAAGNRTGRTVSAGAAPLVCDADSDGLPDTAETGTGSFVSPGDTGTNAFLSDTDGDGLVDGLETNTGTFVSASNTGSNPHVADSDGDGMSDGAEVAAGTDPNTPPATVPGLSPLGLRVLMGVLLAVGSLLAWRVRRKQRLAAMSLLLVLPSLALFENPAQAAVCGPSAVTLGVGETKQTKIRAAAADEAISNGTLYTLASNTAPVSVSPAVQNTFQFARFQVTGTSLGSGVVQIDWTTGYSSGSCTLAVSVVATPPPATSANNLDSAKADGVNLFTGERLLGPWSLFALGGPLPLNLQLSYASGRVRDSQQVSNLGDNWLHTYDTLMFNEASGIRIALSSGRTLYFSQSLDQGGVSFTLQDPQETPYQLVTDGAEFVLLHPWSHLRHRFNAAGHLVSIFDRNGNTLTLTYNGELLSQVSDGLGRVLSFSYDGNHFLSQVSDGTRTVAFSVIARQLAQLTDAEGNATQFTYTNEVADTPGLLTVIGYADGSVPYTVGYSSSGRVSSKTAAAPEAGGTGGAVSFVQAGGLLMLTDEAGETSTFTHDADGNLLSEVDGNENTTTWSYDASGRPTGHVDAEGRSSNLGYEGTSGAVAQITRADTTTQSWVFEATTDALGLVDVDAVRVNRYDGSELSFNLDSAGDVLSVTDAANQTWTYSYNARGQLRGSNSPSGVGVSFSYNPDGTLAAWSDPAGNVTTLGYDSLKRPIQLNYPDATSTQRSVNANGAVTGFTDALNQTTQITRDALGRVSQVTDPALGTWTRAYDTMGLLAGQSNPLGAGPSFDYDARGQLSAVTDETGRTTHFDYDPAGRPASITDNAGQTSTYAFNAVGFLSSYTNPLSQTWSFGRNALDQLAQVTSPLGHAWSRTPDALNRTIGISGPRGRSWTTARDARGLVQAHTRPDGSWIAIARNADGRITSLTDPRGQTWTRSLDAAGRTASTTDPIGNQIAHSCDNRNRLSERTYPGVLGSETRSYNANGDLSQRVFSDGASHSFTYDVNRCLSSALSHSASGSVTSVALTRDAAGRITGSNGLTIGHDAAGRIISISFGPGQALQFSYGATGHLATVTDWTSPSPSLSFTTDAAGRPTSIARDNGTTTAFSYDAGGQLAGIQHLGLGGPPAVLASLTLTRGPDGLVTAASRTADLVDPGSSPDTKEISWDAASRPTSVTGGNVGAISHDTLLQRTSDDLRSYAWNLDGTLLSYTQGLSQIGVLSDAFGSPSRVGTTSFSWNFATPRPTLASITDGVTTKLLVSHPVTGNLLYEIDPVSLARTYYYHDEKNNTWLLSGDDGSVLVTYSYSPDGQQVAAAGDAAETAANPFTWGGASGVQQLADGLFLIPDGSLFDTETASVIGRVDVELDDADSDTDKDSDSGTNKDSDTDAQPRPSDKDSDSDTDKDFDSDTDKSPKSHCDEDSDSDTDKDSDSDTDKSPKSHCDKDSDFGWDSHNYPGTAHSFAGRVAPFGSWPEDQLQCGGFQHQALRDDPCDDGQLASVEFQSSHQKETQTMNMLSSILKTMRDTAMSVIKNFD